MDKEEMDRIERLFEELNSTIEKNDGKFWKAGKTGFKHWNAKRNHHTRKSRKQLITYII